MSSKGCLGKYVSSTEALLDLRKLRLLRELADRGTIAAVAQALDYTPSAVSQQLSALEREVGAPLLEKAGRRLRLTDAGLALVEHAAALLARDDPILVALPPAHPLAGRRRVPLAALAGERWAVPRAGTGFAGMVVHSCRSLGGFDPDIRHRSNDLRILVALVGSGDAVALLPALGHQEGAAGVELREIAERRVRRSVFSAHRRAAGERPTVAAVRSILDEVARAPGPRALI